MEICTRLFYPFDTPRPQNIEGWGEGIRPAAGYILPPLLIQKKDTVVNAPELHPFMPPISFSIQPTQKRIFCFGGSTTLGVPFEKNPEKTFPYHLQEILNKAGESVEVINLGGASFGSDHVLELGLEALSYSPSYLVIYSGNNEFFTHMINWEAQNKAWVYQKTPISHFLAHIQAVLSPITNLQNIHEQQHQRWQNLLQGMLIAPEYVDEKTLSRKDPIQKAVIERYLHNFTLLNQRATEQNVPIIFAVVPSNLNTAPAISIHSPQQTNRQQWLSQYQQVQTDQESCMQSLEYLTEQNPWYAEAWYKRALCARIHNKPSERWFQAARDLDMLPGRPNQALTEAVLQSPLPLMLFESKPEFFHDSCHLTETGYYALAEQFSQVILSHWKFSTPSP